ncbi:uncharacterized protein EV420DRAFT_1507881 [Desarmillaria tabescens]|uniref:Uncharacterized protein n=1 Tax=Armillaria tabescens TaxID=1929756 RepID=A0AA39TQS3_ARMTA|nr:uncharacterized protein EV420DRAFT_1507881 [Desarmillaria tabescens]KAK0467247.1 hypothetical protein EV420DRAFT_1507881 [Desarmillaria tabescens]
MFLWSSRHFVQYSLTITATSSSVPPVLLPRNGLFDFHTGMPRQKVICPDCCSLPVVLQCSSSTAIGIATAHTT